MAPLNLWNQLKPVGAGVDCRLCPCVVFCWIVTVRLICVVCVLGVYCVFIWFILCVQSFVQVCRGSEAGLEDTDEDAGVLRLMMMQQKQQTERDRQSVTG